MPVSDPRASGDEPTAVSIGGEQAAVSIGDARVVVTGGARGIGAAIVDRFRAAGAAVAALDRSFIDAELDAEVVRVEVELSEPSSVAVAMDQAIGLLGGIDVLVNNAGIFRITPLLEIEPDEWDEMFAVNTRSMLLTTQAAARAMIAAGSGGCVVNMASMGGKVGAAGQAHYAASKAAVISLTQVSAAELGRHGINVNAVCPGYVLTEMGADTRTAEQIAEWSARSPLGRLATPDDVANMVMFLASPASAYCTGQAFNVTGGMITH
ncbi:MAG: SDR family NAD(P)-dependent oxidoreductase [Acidimicrobiales bacterium]